MNEIYDLRSALEVLKANPGQLVETDVEADPNAEISGIYRYVGAGGTVPRPTRQDGPAMLFNNVKGFPGGRVVIGMLASRKRVGLLLGADYQRLGWHLRNAVKNPISPLCQVHPRPLHRPHLCLHPRRGGVGGGDPAVHLFPDPLCPRWRHHPAHNARHDQRLQSLRRLFDTCDRISYD